MPCKAAVARYTGLRIRTLACHLRHACANPCPPLHDLQFARQESVGLPSPGPDCPCG
ncbi:hypothetical protein CBM2609_A140237 [Cupriavidus taiwanensis]|nr:hypothetical protein CBM2604_A120235 [Cupriavidus taiwanensis]SOZ25512.1 hypothetical protein CBM2609_A140237 [Cupriavidus taiwanensis]SOZ44763.1 hypothetical protein CBM2610_A150237 [Cupriavidus taiwanensis]